MADYRPQIAIVYAYVSCIAIYRFDLRHSIICVKGTGFTDEPESAMSAVAIERSAGSDDAPMVGLNLIGADWSPAGSGATIPVCDPATGRTFGSIPAGDAADVDRAVTAARRSFDAGIWRDAKPAARARILWQVATLIEERAEQIAALETRDNGMPLVLSRALVAAGAETFRYFAGWCTKLGGMTVPVSAPGDYHAYTLREPLGVAGLITPWNVPFVMACNKVAVALAAGCSVVLKPAEDTSLSALLLGRILGDAGLPPGVVNIVCGTGEAAGAALAAHRDVDKIGFTGSTAVGKRIVQAALGNMKKVSLELGGKSPVIVTADADLDVAVAGIARGMFTNSGQACIAGTRIYVHRSIHDELARRLARTAADQRVGDGRTADTTLGPLISERQLARVDELVRSGIADGAKVLTGGRRIGTTGWFYAPTVMTAPRVGARILREEIFGPVANLLPFDDLEAVITAANDSDYGLAAAIWTGDIALGHRVARRLRAGTIWINCQLVTDRAIPFGGYKQSGWGRENGLEGLDAYLQTKSVFTAL